MKFLVSSDWHLRDDKPRCRIDKNWYETQRERLKWVVETVNTYECPLFIAGDIMHKGTNTQYLENIVLEELKKANYPIYSIAGNHDVAYHNYKHIQKSTYWVLVQSGVLQHVDGVIQTEVGEVQGSSFNTEITDGDNILLCHESVYPKQVPFYMKACTASELLNTYSFSIILTGDIHIPFYKQLEGKTLINPGGLFVQEASKRHMELGLFVYDYGKVQRIPIEVNQDVIVDDYLYEEKERDERIDSFIEKIHVSQDVGFSFKDNIYKELQINTVSQETKEIILKATQGELHD